MNQEYAVLYNRSLERIFGRQARAVALELDCPCRYTDEILLSGDDEIEFQKCVYFDKDIVTGLRLETMGIRLYNNIGSIELCDDKRRTNELLRREGLIPDTIPAPLFFYEPEGFKQDFLAKVESKLGFPMVAKRAFGSLGEQVKLLKSPDELAACYEEWKGLPHLYQKFVASSAGKDVRIYVVGGEVVGCMERSNPNDFRSNIGSGGHGKQIIPPEGFEKTAIDVCALLGLDFGGVDLLYGPDGRPLVCEVNSNALFNELNQVCGVCVEKHIAELVRRPAEDFNNLFF